MKKQYLISKYFLLSLLVCFSILTSCKNKEDDLGDTPRLFRPVLTVTTSGNSMKLEWKKIAEATSFTLDLSKDSFQTIYRSVVTDSATYSFSDLDWDYNYFIRIKCDGTTKSSEYYVAEQQITYPTLLLSLSSDDVTDVAVRARWISNAANYTSMKVLKASNDSLVKELNLTAGDTANKYKEIGGLLANTNYKVVVYSGEKYEGRKVFKTAEAQLFDIPVDLRRIPDDSASSMLTTSFLQSLASGSTVILKRDMHYAITSQTYFDKSLTFVTGLGFGGPATLDMSSSLNLAASASVDSLQFIGVNFIGTNPSAGFAGNFGGYYVFNINTTSSAQTILFDGCVIKYLRGVCRVQAGGPKLKSFTINNCIIDSIAGYGIANVDNVDAAIENITITNSTITNAVHFIRSTRNPVTTTKTIRLENCTFYRIPQSANYFLDISGTTTIETGASVKNCIIGPGLPSTANPPTTNISGYRAANIPLFTNSGNYKTLDLTWTTPESAIPEFTEYSGNSTDLFTNPGTGDFSFKDLSFSGKSTAGDPRWRE